MNYRHVYMLIIEHAKSEMNNGLRPLKDTQRKNFPNKYFEFHHILPRSLYPNWTKRKSNIVALTSREHFFCHQLLTKIYPFSEEMSYALYYMSNSKKYKNKLTSRMYERLKEKVISDRSRSTKNLWKNKEYYNKQVASHIGYTFREESKDKIKEHWINGIYDNRPPISYETKLKISQTLRNKYSRGDLKTWNKGKSCSEEQKRKISASEKGKKMSEQSKVLISKTSKRLSIAIGKLYHYHKEHIDSNIKWMEFRKIYKKYYNIDKNSNSIYTVLHSLGIEC